MSKNECEVTENRILFIERHRIFSTLFIVSFESMSFESIDNKLIFDKISPVVFVFGEWCNGSTPDSGSGNRGSSPCSPAIILVSNFQKGPID